MEKLAKKHQVPFEIMEQWLEESYQEVSKKFGDKLSGKKEKKKKPDGKMLPDDMEWLCPFCDNINRTVKCSGCDAFLDMKKWKDKK